MSGRARLSLAIRARYAVTESIRHAAGIDPCPVEPAISVSALASACHVDAFLSTDANILVLEALINRKIRY